VSVMTRPSAELVGEHHQEKRGNDAEANEGIDEAPILERDPVVLLELRSDAVQIALSNPSNKVADASMKKRPHR